MPHVIVIFVDREKGATRKPMQNKNLLAVTDLQKSILDECTVYRVHSLAKNKIPPTSVSEELSISEKSSRKLPPLSKEELSESISGCP